MKVKEFNKLMKDVKKGNVEGLKEVISELTLSQAQTLENLIMDLPLNDELNHLLDELVIYIDSLVMEEKKVANKKQAPAKPEPEKVKPVKTEVQAPEKAPAKTIKPFNTIKVGDTFYLQVEGEEVTHSIKVIFKGKNNIVGIMEENEEEVFLIRKTDFNKQVFTWTDRHGEQYNIKVILK